MEEHNHTLYKKERFERDNIEIRLSPIQGYGVFATKDFSPKEVIEECPVIIFQRLDLDYRESISNRLFFWDDANSAIALGCGSIYNHAEEGKDNAAFSIDRNNQQVVFIATKHIAAGTEILINYGDDWFASRKNKGLIIDQQKNESGLFKITILFLTLLALSKIFPVGLASSISPLPVSQEHHELRK
ncbi:MAG TPA: hypothetical protein DEA62_02955 [Coxiellaceae bacterium]|nr:hypothetical protein [Coxiellaceae bacterium]